MRATEVYFYDFTPDAAMRIDDQGELFFDSTGGGDALLLQNDLKSGRHGFWWTNHNQLYAYVFDIQPGENRLRPRFVESRYSYSQITHEFDQGQEVLAVDEVKPYKYIDGNWETAEAEMSLRGTLQAQRQGESITFQGDLVLTHPGGEVTIPLDLRGNAVDARESISTEWETLYEGEDYLLGYQLR